MMLIFRGFCMRLFSRLGLKSDSPDEAKKKSSFHMKKSIEKYVWMVKVVVFYAECGRFDSTPVLFFFPSFSLLFSPVFLPCFFPPSLLPIIFFHHFSSSFNSPFYVLPYPHYTQVSNTAFVCVVYYWSQEPIVSIFKSVQSTESR